MLGHMNTNGIPDMSRNLFRQSFWAVFAPLLLVAGLFWLDELRGYRGEMTVLALPRTELATDAAENISALAQEMPFALAVYSDNASGENPLIGKTPAERQAFWKKTAEVRLVRGSDVIRVSALGGDPAEAVSLAKSITAELVRTASRYYNQKTDLDIRIVAEPVAIPSFTAWPRFLSYILGTAFFFTLLFFVVYSVIERLFPKRSATAQIGNGEYVITPDTFKPRVPAYWDREEQTHLVGAETLQPMAPEPAFEEEPEALAAEEAFDVEEEVPVSTEYVQSEWSGRDSDVEEGLSNESGDAVTSSEPEPFEAASTGYVSHAAAPDNLPIVDTVITPLQGAQARLMRADIDAAVVAREALNDPALLAETSKPQTHEPTLEEYRRRLNELLSGKM